MDRGVIRIRYENFSAGTHDVTVTGLHGRAEPGERGVTLYLLPGLSDEQRRAVFRRLRQEASRGFAPPLPLPQLAVAIGVDRLRSAARIIRALVRLHPVVTLVPAAFVAAAMALFVIASSAGPGSTARAQAGLAGTAPAGSGKVIQAAGRTAGSRGGDRGHGPGVGPLHTAHLPGPRDFAR